MSWIFDLLFGRSGASGSDDDDYSPRGKENKKQHELPERIRKLPKDDPERMRFEKGWKNRERQQGDAEYSYSFSSSPLFASLTGLVMLGIISFLGYSAYKAHQEYMEEVYALRSNIRKTILRKGYDTWDPLVFPTVMKAENTSWIPSLKSILGEVNQIRPRLAVEWDASNPQSGSYLSYINKRNLPFDETEAMRWTVNEYRNR